MVIRERMGRLLLEAQLVSEDQIQEALQVQRSKGIRLGSILVGMGAVSEAILLEFLSQQYGVPTVDLSCCKIEREVLNLVPIDLAQQYMIVPVRQFRSRLALAMVDPSNIAVIDEMRFRTGLHVTPLVAMESDIQTAIRRWYELEPSERNSYLGEGRAPSPPSTFPTQPNGVETPFPYQSS